MQGGAHTKLAPNGVVCYECDGKGQSKPKRKYRQRNGHRMNGRYTGSRSDGKSTRFATMNRSKGIMNNYMEMDEHIVMDSGASEHVLKDPRFFESMEEDEEITIETADGSKKTTNIRGAVRVRLFDGIILVVSNVYYMPELDMNLIPCTQLDTKGISISFADGRCCINDRNDNGALLGYANRRSSDGLFIASMIKPKKEASVPIGAARKIGATDAKTWHIRMGHVGKNIVDSMCNDMEYGMKIDASWWGDALLHATHLYNRTATKVLKNRTPYVTDKN